MELAQPQADGYTLRQHYEVAARQGDKTSAAELAGGRPPDLLAWLWRGFIELDRARGSGHARLAYSDIEAWARLTGRRLSPADVALIVELDQLVFQIKAKTFKGRK